MLCSGWTHCLVWLHHSADELEMWLIFQMQLHEEPETIVATSPRLRLIVGRYPKHSAWQSLRDSNRPSGTGKRLCCSFCGVKRNTVKLLWWAQWNLRYPDPALRAWWEEEGRRLRERRFMANKNIYWSLDRSCVNLYNLTKSSWPLDTSRWPEPRIFSSSWPALSLDSKIWNIHFEIRYQNMTDLRMNFI